MFSKIKTLFVDLYYLISAAVRYAVYVPLYKVIVHAHKNKLPSSWLIQRSLNGQRKARHDLKEMTRHFAR